MTHIPGDRDVDPSNVVKLPPSQNAIDRDSEMGLISGRKSFRICLKDPALSSDVIALMTVLIMEYDIANAGITQRDGVVQVSGQEPEIIRLADLLSNIIAIEKV